MLTLTLTLTLYLYDNTNPKTNLNLTHNVRENEHNIRNIQGGPEKKPHKVWRSIYFVPVDMLSSIIHHTIRTCLLSPLPSNRHHPSSGDCLEGKGENY